ncbi:hypothetical protein EAE96_010285 [Botrytis aclada]|nr:hypothetical protein EAE96_010285 [Botrytis aclada]
MRSNQDSSNSSRPRAKPQRNTPLSSSYRVQKPHFSRSTHNGVRNHENTLARPLVQTPRLCPAIVLRPATPTPVIKKRRSLPILRGSQTHPGPSSSQHRIVKSTGHGVSKGAQKFASRKFERGGPFNRREESGNEGSKQRSSMMTQGEDMHELEMGLSRLSM